MSEDPQRVADSSRDGRLPITRRDYVTYANVLALTPFAAGRAAADAESDTTAEAEPEPLPAPSALQVEYEREPNNLSPAGDPRFTWTVHAESRGRGQSAFRILVASSASTLADDEGDVWDSGKVESARSVNVEFDGEVLESDATYHWKVRVWDEIDEPTPWSEPATFATAIPDTEDHWTGEWIGPDFDRDERPGSEWSDYALEAEFEIVDGAVGFLARASDEENCYLWHLRPSGLDLWLIDDGGWELLDGIDVDGVSEGDVHHVEMEVDGDEITTVLDGTEIHVHTDSTHDSGTIGFVQFDGEHARIHSVSVTDLDGEVLFEDEFDALDVENFDGGDIYEGTLDLDSTEFVLRSEDRAAPLLRREFDLGKSIESARVHVSGLGFYELHVNGERVGDRVLDPGRTDYEETILYSTYDVTDTLRSGTNVVGAALGRGRLGELNEDTWGWSDVSWWSDPQLLVQLNVEFADGTTTSVVTDEDWTVATGPTRHDSLFGGEVYDARLERPGWTDVGYDDIDWERVSAVDSPGGEYRPQRVQPIEVTETLEPVEITEPEDGVYVFDVGEMVAGWVELTVEGDAGTEVTLTHGEMLDGDGLVDNSSIDQEEPIQVSRYVLDGEGTETWEPRFTYKGFRYVQVEGYPGEPNLDALEAKLVHTTVDGVESGFESSNELFNRIHEKTRRAMLNNLHSVFTDTPTYEKNGWTGDIRASAEMATQNFWMPRFWEKFLRDCADAQAEDGEIPYLVPAPVYGYGSNDPPWDSAYVFVAWWTYEYYDDEAVLEEHYDAMKRYVEFVRDESDGHVVRTGHGDWGAPGGREAPEGPGIVATACYYRSAEILAETAAVLGHEDDAAAFEQLAAEIEDAFNDEFFDPETNVYETGAFHVDDPDDADEYEIDEYRQTSNVLPLAFGLVPDGHEAAVADTLAEQVMDTYDGHLHVGVVGLQHLLPVLTEYGHLDVAMTIATQRTYPSWGHWFDEGMVSLLEFWELDARSRTHHFLGTIDQWFYEYLAGIRSPDEPGYERVTIKPHVPDDLESASATTETIRGTVAAAWEQTDDGLALDVTIPWNATAEVHVPGRYEQAVTEGGEPASDVPDLAFVRSADGYAVFEVGSGAYHFESDPTCGALGFVRDTAREERDGLDDRRRQLRKRLDRIVDRVDSALAAYDAGDDEEALHDVHRALSTVSQLEGNRRAAAIADAVDAMADALSEASRRLLEGDVGATLAIDGDLQAGADETAELSATVHNASDERLNDLSVSIDAPDGWTVSPTGPARVGNLKPGETFTATYDVAAPLDQASLAGGVEMTGVATYRHRGGTARIPATTRVAVDSPVRFAGLTAETVEPGGESVVRATVENRIDEPVSGDVSIDLPEGWSGAATEPYEVGPDGSQTVATTVTAPDGIERDTETRLPVTATYEGHAGAYGTASVAVPFAPLPNGFSAVSSTEARFGTEDDELVIDAGGEEVWNGVDEYGALFRPAEQAGETATATVKVTSQEDTSDWANAGIMIRNDATKPRNSTGYVLAAATPRYGFFLEWDSDGDGYVDSRETAGEPVYPGWVRLEKDGDTFTGSYSTDGESWSEIGTVDVPEVADAQDVALFVTAANTEERSTATFDEFEVDSSTS